MIQNFDYSTRTINRNFKIKVYGLGLNKLVGVAGFREVVGDDALCNRLLDRAFNSMDDKQVCKLGNENLKSAFALAFLQHVGTFFLKQLPCFGLSVTLTCHTELFKNFVLA